MRIVIALMVPALLLCDVGTYEKWKLKLTDHQVLNLTGRPEIVVGPQQVEETLTRNGAARGANGSFPKTEPTPRKVDKYFISAALKDEAFIVYQTIGGSYTYSDLSDTMQVTAIHVFKDGKGRPKRETVKLTDIALAQIAREVEPPEMRARVAAQLEVRAANAAAILQQLNTQFPNLGGAVGGMGGASLGPVSGNPLIGNWQGRLGVNQTTSGLGSYDLVFAFRFDAIGQYTEVVSSGNELLMQASGSYTLIPSFDPGAPGHRNQQGTTHVMTLTPVNVNFVRPEVSAYVIGSDLPSNQPVKFTLGIGPNMFNVNSYMGSKGWGANRVP